MEVTKVLNPEQIAEIRARQVLLKDWAKYARTDIPALCDTIEVLERENERLKGELDHALDVARNQPRHVVDLVQRAMFSAKDSEGDD